MSGIVVDASYWLWNWNYFMISPFISVDSGPAVRARWGQTPIAVPPGEHHVTVQLQWLPGRVTLPVYCRPGESVVVYYRAPVYWFMTGALDYRPPDPPGRQLGLVLLLGSVALMVLVLAGVLAYLLLGR